MTRSHYAGLLLLMLLPLAVHGQSLVIIEPSDKKLVIRGSIGDDNSFIGHVGATVEGGQGANPIKLNVYPYVLTMVNGTSTETIRPVIVPTDQTLTPNAPSTLQVKVTGVKEPGEYRGKISLSLAGQARDATEFIELTVFATVRPSLSLLTENDRLQANLVNCKYNCALARLLLSDAAFQSKTELSFEKPVGAPLVISNVTIAVKGDHSKFKVDDKLLKVSLANVGQSQPPGGSNQPPSSQGAGTPDAASANSDPSVTRKYLTLPVVIARNELPADHYSGNIYVTVAGQSNALKVPVDFNVRSAPLWPLLVLLLGILLGRLFKFMQDKGNAIADALESIDRLEFRLRNVNSEDAGIVVPMLRAARDLVDENRVTEAVAAATAISARLSTLNELRQIQERLTGREGDPAVAAILSDIREARERLRHQQDEQAKTLVNEIRDALVALEATPGVTDRDAGDFADAAKRANFASAAIAGLGTVRWSALNGLRSGAVLLSGLSNQFRNEATLFLVRPILWLALLIGLVALGLKTLYIDNPIFGASPFTDFLGLVFWGLSTDVASRTLSGLTLNNASRPAAG